MPRTSASFELLPNTKTTTHVMPVHPESTVESISIQVSSDRNLETYGMMGGGNDKEGIMSTSPSSIVSSSPSELGEAVPCTSALPKPKFCTFEDVPVVLARPRSAPAFKRFSRHAICWRDVECWSAHDEWLRARIETLTPYHPA